MMFAAAHAGVAFAGAPGQGPPRFRSPHVFPRHPPAALRPGVSDLRRPDLDGGCAETRAARRRGSPCRHRAAAAGLAGAGRAGRQRLREPARAAAPVLCAGDPGARHAQGRFPLRGDELDVRGDAALPRLRPHRLERGADSRRRLRRRRDHPHRHVDHLRRPHPLARHAGLMTPAARLSAAIEVFSDIEARRRPAADGLKDWGLAHRFAGSKDRAAIASLVYDALRRKASAAWIMGERFAPAPLTEDERNRLTAGSLDAAPAHVAGDFPEWIDSSLARAFGDDLVPEMQALATRAPLDIRANTLKA